MEKTRHQPSWHAFMISPKINDLMGMNKNFVYFNNTRHMKIFLHSLDSERGDK